MMFVSYSFLLSLFENRSRAGALINFADRPDQFGRAPELIGACGKNQKGTGKLPVRYVLSPCLLWGFSHFEASFIADTLLYDQYFVVFKCLVAAGDDTLARLQTFEHLVVLRVLAAYADVAAIGFRAALVKDEDPLSACGLEEGAARDEDGLLWLTQFEVDEIGLARADVLRAFAAEDEITTELALAHLGIDLSDL